MIEEAQDTIHIMNPIITDEDIVDRLVAASERGVKVDIVLSEKSNNGAADKTVKHFYPRLLEAGVELWEYPNATTHAKLLVVDDKAHFGTVNLDTFSLFRSYEVAMVAEDADLADRFRSEVFEVDIARSKKGTKPSVPDLVRSWFYYKLAWFL